VSSLPTLLALLLATMILPALSIAPAVIPVVTERPDMSRVPFDAITNFATSPVEALVNLMVPPPPRRPTSTIGLLAGSLITKPVPLTVKILPFSRLRTARRGEIERADRLVVLIADRPVRYRCEVGEVRSYERHRLAAGLGLPVVLIVPLICARAADPGRRLVGGGKRRLWPRPRLGPRWCGKAERYGRNQGKTG
jgi:hypothetical protein